MRDIPKEHRHLLEAQRLESAQNEFLAASNALLAANRAARNAGKYETDEMHERAEALDIVQKRMKEAEAEYDRAVGEPKPVKLTRITHEKLRQTFAPELQDEAIRLLEAGLTMRLPFTDTIEDLERVRLAVLKLANGDLAELERQIQVAKVDWRDVIGPAEYPEAWARGLSESSKLDEKAKKELLARDREQYLAWLGKPPKRSFIDGIIGLFTRKKS